MWSKARHKDSRHRVPRLRTVEVVDALTGVAHQLTMEALAAAARGRCIALCGSEVLPASLAAPPTSRCRSCVWIPTQMQSASRDERRAGQVDRVPHETANSLSIKRVAPEAGPPAASRSPIPVTAETRHGH